MAPTTLITVVDDSKRRARVLLNGTSPEFAWANRGKFLSKAFPEINPKVASR
jgi:hypothetical protein